MNRRQRILTALGGGIPDRPPIAFDSRAPLQLLLDYYGAKDKNDLYRVAGIDGFSVWEWNAVMGRYAGVQKFSPDGEALDFWGNLSQHMHGLGDCNSIGELERHAWPRVEDFDFSAVREQALQIKSMDMVVSAGHLGLGYQMHNMLRGNENALLDVSDDAWMERYLRRLSDFTCGYLEALLSAGGGEIEVVRADDDLGTMDRLMISPDMWRRLYKPCWKRAFDIVHAHGARVWFHSCGYIWPLLEDLIEVGVDCWNPFPPYVKDNDHERLARWRKGRLALDGGVNHLLLASGTPVQVADETRRVLDRFAPDGGLLIGPSQVITSDVPVANMIALFETATAYK